MGYATTSHNKVTDGLGRGQCVALTPA